MTVDTVIRRIRCFIRENHLSNLRFAKTAGVPESLVRRLFEPDFNGTINTVRKLESPIPDDYCPEEILKDNPTKKLSA